MNLFFRISFSLVAILTLSIPLGAGAEEIVLKPRYQPGDSYALSLRTTNQTTVASKNRKRGPFAEDVQLEYRARVVILETDREGQPVRERHEEVSFGFQRPGESGSLFNEHANFEVRRTADGELQLFANDARLDRSIEKLVGDVLANQFEHSLAPALFAPGREVAVGETWELDSALTRRFLRERGARVIRFESPPTATLVERSGAGGERERVIQYVIPVDRWEPSKAPANLATAASHAHIEGEIRLAADSGASVLAHTSNLVMRVNGVVTAPGVAAPVPWKLETARSSEQSTRTVKRSLAANF
jgi:hypothetical protein